MTDQPPSDDPVDQPPGSRGAPADPPPSADPADQPAARRAAPEPQLPDYKGQPLDPDRGPGLGCFWFQVAVLAVLLVATPLSVAFAVEPWISGLLLIVTLVLLLLVGQTMIFLLRLVAADRRSRRRPLSGTARRTVGMIEDETSDKDDAGSG